MSFWNHAEKKRKLLNEIKGVEYVKMDVNDTLQILKKETLTEQDIEDVKSSLICIRENFNKSIDGLIDASVKI